MALPAPPAFKLPWPSRATAPSAAVDAIGADGRQEPRGDGSARGYGTVPVANAAEGRDSHTLHGGPSSEAHRPEPSGRSGEGWGGAGSKVDDVIARVLEADELNRAGRTWWAIIHGAGVAAMLLLPTSLRHSLRHFSDAPGFLLSYMLLLALTLLQYARLSTSSPGYVAEVVAQIAEDSADVEAQGGPSLAADASQGGTASGGGHQVVSGTGDEGTALGGETGGTGAGAGGSVQSGADKAAGETPVASQLQGLQVGVSSVSLVGTSHPISSSGSGNMGQVGKEEVAHPLETTPLLSRTRALPREDSSWLCAFGGARSASLSAGDLPLWSPRGSLRHPPGEEHAQEDPLLLDLRYCTLDKHGWKTLLRSRSKRSCPYCQQAQPVRSKHCYDCGKCVVQFDHHCSWVGTCIGWRNHTHFWWYLLLDCSLTVWTTAIALSAVDWSPAASWWLSSIALILSLLLATTVVFLATLFGFHTYLILTNQTTYEATRKQSILYLRDIPPSIHPFSKGVLRNLYLACCLPEGILPIYLVPSMSRLCSRTMWSSLSRS